MNAGRSSCLSCWPRNGEDFLLSRLDAPGIVLGIGIGESLGGRLNKRGLFLG